MFDCKTCHHSDMVHRNFAGCCGHQGCPCTGFDGLTSCSDHGQQCWWANPRKQPAASEVEIKLAASGNGYRYEVVVRGETVKAHRRAAVALRWVKDTYGFELPALPAKPC